MYIALHSLHCYIREESMLLLVIMDAVRYRWMDDYVVKRTASRDADKR